VAELAAAGTDADGVRSLLASSLGLADPGEPVTMSELVARFDPAGIPTTPWTYPTR
jgi:glutamyl-tRNA synthetase